MHNSTDKNTDFIAQSKKNQFSTQILIHSIHILEITIFFFIIINTSRVNILDKNSFRNCHKFNIDYFTQSNTT